MKRISIDGNEVDFYVYERDPYIVRYDAIGRHVNGPRFRDMMQWGCNKIQHLLNIGYELEHIEVNVVRTEKNSWKLTVNPYECVENQPFDFYIDKDDISFIVKQEGFGAKEIYLNDSQKSLLKKFLDSLEE